MPEWFIYAALSAVFAALTAIFAKLGVKDIDSDFATFIRTIVVILMLALLLSVAKKWQPLSSLNPKNWLFLILSGIATGLSWLMYFKAMQVGKVYQVALVDKFSVVLAIILAVIFLGERLNLKEILAVCLIVSGVFLLIFK
ncbi:EamA family transporter [Campylobacter concisus]